MMTCNEYRQGWMEYAAPGPSAHLAACAECSQFLEEQQTLSVALRSLASHTAAELPPPFLETRLLAEFDSVSRRPRLPWWSPALVATAVTCALALLLLRTPAPVVPGPAEAGSEPPFVEIPYTTPPAPYERIEMKRMDVPVATLMAVGLRVQTLEPVESIPAEVLVGQDGRVHAIRLIAREKVSSGTQQ
jgi:hypothetical protein